jgi:alkylation response protein AidB-like acyl-CoA dehydrogenase
MTELDTAGRAPGGDLLDGSVLALDRYLSEITADVRQIGAALDRDPYAITNHLDAPAVRLSRYAAIPARFWPELDIPADVAGALDSCLGMTLMAERLAYADPNVFFASPGPSLTSGVMTALAEKDQYDRYFSLLAEQPLYAFFGLTEPGKGSAATELETTVAPDGDGWVVNGEKCYIGDGARARLGVVFCRRAPGPVGVEAVLVATDTPGFSAQPLPMVGLRGAGISRLRLDNVRVPHENLLGAHLRPTRRGLRGALHILYRARPGIAAMALGCAQAACDYLTEHERIAAKRARLRLDHILDRIAATRLMIYGTAADVDRGVINAHRIGAVKVAAARVAEDATLLAAELLGPASLIEHPWLEKTYRDVRAFEIMEGTVNLHRQSVFQGLLKGTFLDGPADEGRRCHAPGN